jgi:hypothetical protein
MLLQPPVGWGGKQMQRWQEDQMVATWKFEEDGGGVGPSVLFHRLVDGGRGTRHCARWNKGRKGCLWMLVATRDVSWVVSQAWW